MRKRSMEKRLLISLIPEVLVLRGKRWSLPCLFVLAVDGLTVRYLSFSHDIIKSSNASLLNASRKHTFLFSP